MPFFHSSLQLHLLFLCVMLQQQQQQHIRMITHDRNRTAPPAIDPYKIHGIPTNFENVSFNYTQLGKKVCPKHCSPDEDVLGLFSGDVFLTVIDADVLKDITIDEAVCKNAEELFVVTAVIKKLVAKDERVSVGKKE